MTSMKLESSIEELDSLLQRSSALPRTMTSYLTKLIGLIVHLRSSRSIPSWPLLAAFRVLRVCADPFVDHVNLGPYFIHKQHYEALGDWDFSFSRAGEPGICFDSELCLRAWLNGYQVGYWFVPFKGPLQHYSLDGGTMLFSKGVRFRNEWENHRKIFQKYSRQADQISKLVKEANHSIGLTTD
jgi:hypothetical protein